MSKTNTAATTQRAFRLPHDVYARLTEEENMTAYLVQALREKFRRDALKKGKSKEGAE